MKPFFTVVIPLYNKERYILNTLNSVLNQSYPHYEIILVEDCSTDAGLAVAASVVSEKIRIIQHEQNKGLSASRNTGIKNAQYDYIAFLDADDVWKETFLAEMANLITSYPGAQLFASNYEEIHADRKIIHPQNNADKFATHSVIPDFFAISLAQPLYCPSSLCVHRSVFDRIGFYNENITYGEDVDFNIRANSVFRLAYTTQHLVSYHTLTENQITRSTLSDKVITDFDAYDNETTPPTLKKFLDFNRYIMAKYYLMEDNRESYTKMKRGIAASSLNAKQWLLLHSTKGVLLFLKKVKLFFIRKGILLTTYD